MRFSNLTPISRSTASTSWRRRGSARPAANRIEWEHGFRVPVAKGIVSEQSATERSDWRIVNAGGYNPQPRGLKRDQRPATERVEH